MGSKGSRTHPEEEEPPRYDYDYEYDQRDDYDSGWHPEKDYGTAYFEEKGAPVIKRKRSCTDVLCLLLLFVFLAGWGAMAYFAFTMGDINRVVHPTDSEGNICGRGLMSDRPYLLMFDMTQCLNPAVLVEGCLTPQACVEKCPTETYSPLTDITRSLGAAVFGQSVPATSEASQQAIKDRIQPFCRKAEFLEKGKDLSVKELIDTGICPPWYLKSSPIFGLCLPITFEDNSTRLNDTIANIQKTLDNSTLVDLERGRTRFGAFLAVRQFGERVFSDLKETYWMVGLALLGACIISFVWIILMRFLAGALVYTSILVVFLGIGSLLGYCGHTLYRVWQSTDPETNRRIYELNWTPEILDDFLKQKDTWIAFTSILGIIFLVIICLFIFLWQRIRIAIALIEQGSKAVGQMFSSLFFPVLPFLLQLVVLAWFLVVALFLSSWGTQEFRIALKSNRTGVSDTACPCSWPNSTDFVLEPGQLCLPSPSALLPTDGDQQNATCSQTCDHFECQFVKYSKNKDYSWMQFVNVFGLYWGVFFFTAFGELVLAGVFAEWYWTRDKSKLPACALGSSLWNATIFHLGTVAFGSLIIAIIRMVRTVLEYVEKKCNKFNNDLTKCLLKCCQCCLWCLEKFMRFLNRNAYIMCAVKSSNFCKSAKDAFNLLMRNLVRVVVLDSVVDFLLFLGKLVIVLLTGVTSYLAFAGHIPEIKDQIPSLNYMYTPVVFIVIGSYVIASSFFGVYAMAVDTLFLCFLEDLERNDGSLERPYYMSKGLKAILGKMQRVAGEGRRLH